MSAKKKTVAKKVAKAAKKKTTKKVIRKAVTKKVVGKKAAKKVARKASKTATKVASKKAAKKGVRKKADPIEVTAKKKPGRRGRKRKEDIENSAIKEEVSRRVSEAVRKRIGKKDKDATSKAAPMAFTMDDVRKYLKSRKKDSETGDTVKTAKKAVAVKATKTAPKSEDSLPARPKQNFGAVSVADLLGFDPTAQTAESASRSSEKDIPEKWLPYYRMLVELHDEVSEGLHRHSEETLRRSSKEDSGDLSSYGQHMADAGTDSFERDFALSMVSSEQEALYEIDEAIRRIRNGTYGICEITGKPISRQRLKAVPFARYSIEGQMDVEKGRRKVVQRPGIVGIGADDSPIMSDDDSDDS